MRTRILLVAIVLVAAAALWARQAVKNRERVVNGASKQEVQVRDLNDSSELTAPVHAMKVVHDEATWRTKLDPDHYKVLREAATEAPFSGKLLSEHRDGWYVCHACGLPLFKSDAKFESHCGWPSFHTPGAYENIKLKRDLSHGMIRTEILCARCEGHLGHLFDDGPAPSGLRYCVNSLSLDFKPGLAPPPSETDTAVFAAGCFWGVEKLFHETPGVVATSVGYTGGAIDKPTYKQVCTGRTGHAEAVEVVYNPQRVSYKELVRIFFEGHDPTTMNAQGPDHGTQYRSGIYFRDKEQEKVAREVRDSLVTKKAWTDPVVTEIVEASAFWIAEDYHQKYFLTHPVQCHRPKS